MAWGVLRWRFSGDPQKLGKIKHFAYLIATGSVTKGKSMLLRRLVVLRALGSKVFIEINGDQLIAAKIKFQSPRRLSEAL